MTTEDLFIFTIRTVNAVSWTILFIVLFRDSTPVVPLIRSLISFVIMAGMWVLVVGAVATSYSIDPRPIRLMYTAYTAIAAIVAIGVLTGPWKR